MIVQGELILLDAQWRRDIHSWWDTVPGVVDGLQTVTDRLLVEVTVVCPPWLAHEPVVIRGVTILLRIYPYRAPGFQVGCHVQVGEDIQRILALNCVGFAASEL